MGASYSPAPASDAVVSAKSADISQYHFKDNASDCKICHVNVRRDGFKTSGMESNVCYRCHARVDGAEWVHGPIGVGQCSVCHDPHGSKNAKFLTRTGHGLCTYCHDANRLQNHIATVNSKDCTGCHDPHGGADRDLLR